MTLPDTIAPMIGAILVGGILTLLLLASYWLMTDDDEDLFGGD